MVKLSFSFVMKRQIEVVLLGAEQCVKINGKSGWGVGIFWNIYLYKFDVQKPKYAMIKKRLEQVSSKYAGIWSNLLNPKLNKRGS